MSPQAKLDRFDHYRVIRWYLILGFCAFFVAALVVDNIVVNAQEQQTERTAFMACAQQSDPESCVKQLLGASSTPAILDHCYVKSHSSDDFARCVGSALDSK